MSSAEYSSFVRKGGNFGIGPNCLSAKEFWLTPTGLKFWQGTEFSGPYNVCVAVPQSVIGCYGIVHIGMKLDGHPAAFVYDYDLNKFNSVKRIIGVY